MKQSIRLVSLVLSTIDNTMEQEYHETMPTAIQVKMGSRVSLLFDTGVTLIITIKTPREIDPKNHIVSDESPIGSAVLNKREGETFEYLVGERIFRGKISKILD
jgi:transcription elongation GreA/GreB family factor